MIHTDDTLTTATQAPPAPRSTHLALLPLPPGTRAKPNTPRRTTQDLRTLIIFIHTYCTHQHSQLPKKPANTLDIPALAGFPVLLCTDCTKLLQHALIKRTHCPRDPKPDCKHCPTHCYAPQYRAQIRQVMMFSGRHLLLRGRLDYLWHLFF